MQSLVIRVRRAGLPMCKTFATAFPSPRGAVERHSCSRCAASLPQFRGGRREAERGLGRHFELARRAHIATVRTLSSPGVRTCACWQAREDDMAERWCALLPIEQPAHGDEERAAPPPGAWCAPCRRSRY